MINDTTTCEFMEDCLDMFLHLQLTQQGIPIFQHVQCLGEHFLKLHVCIILSETLIGWELGTMGAIPVFISIMCWVYSPRFVDNETAYKLSTDNSVYKNGDQNWLAVGNKDP